MKLLVVIACSLSFAAAFWFFFCAARHFVQMLQNTKSGTHHSLMNLIPFLIPFIPSIYTEKGQRHLHAFASNALGFLICFGLIAAFFHHYIR